MKKRLLLLGMFLFPLACTAMEQNNNNFAHLQITSMPQTELVYKTASNVPCILIYLNKLNSLETSVPSLSEPAAANPNPFLIEEELSLIKKWLKNIKKWIKNIEWCNNIEEQYTDQAELNVALHVINYAIGRKYLYTDQSIQLGSAFYDGQLIRKTIKLVARNICTLELKKINTHSIKSKTNTPHIIFTERNTNKKYGHDIQRYTIRLQDPLTLQEDLSACLYLRCTNLRNQIVPTSTFDLLHNLTHVTLIRPSYISPALFSLSALIHLKISSLSLYLPVQTYFNQYLSLLSAPLTSLNLDHDNLESWPEDIFYLTALRYLNVANNPLLYKIPKTITLLTNLKALNIRGTGIPNHPRALKTLQTLNLKHCVLNKELTAQEQ